MSKGKGKSGTNNLLHQQISASLQRLLVWCSGDEDGLQNQRMELKKTGGATSRPRNRARVRGVNRVRAGGEHVVLF